MTRLVVEVEEDDVELAFDDVVFALREHSVRACVTYDEPGEDPKVEYTMAEER